MSLFADDFSTYPLGTIQNSYSPWGEYHCETNQGRLGPWQEATCHYSWRTSGGCWRVVDDGGRRAMEQQHWAEQSYPLLVTGEEHWREYTVSVEVRMLSFAAPAGLVIGYRHSRDFYALLLSREGARLIHRLHDKDEVLPKIDMEIGVDEYHRIKLACRSHGIEVEVDGKTMANVELAFPGGPVGLIANAPARFADFDVIAPEPELAAIPARRTDHEAALAKLREQYPQPKLWRKLDTRGFGTDRNMRVGDLNGDGRNEIVLAQPRSYLGQDNFCNVACLTALDLDGKRLWQSGTPTGEEHETTADTCFQLHDLDGDGRAELLYTSDLRLHVADGRTGETRRSVPTPESPPGKRKTDGAYPMARVVGDCLFFADLRGTGRKDTMVLKDRYTRAWVYDDDLNVLWDHACTTGHYPASFDLDGDGREELMLGYTLLNGDGKVLWELDTFDHADGIVMGPLGPEGTPPRIPLTGSDAGFFLLTAEGETLAHHNIGHAQTVAVAKLRHDVAGLQIAVNTYWGEAGVTLITDWEGNVLREFEPMHYASLLHPVNWTHDGTELLLLSGHPTEGGLIDGHGRRVVMFPDDGHPILCCDCKDLDGDGIDELVVWDYDSIWIYKPDPLPDKTPEQYPIRNDFFNESNYSGQFSFPRSP